MMLGVVISIDHRPRLRTYPAGPGAGTPVLWLANKQVKASEKRYMCLSCMHNAEGHAAGEGKKMHG